MSLKLSKTDTLAIIFIFLLIFGILSSFVNFGLLSVFFSVSMPFILLLNFALAFYGLLRKKQHYIIGVLLFFIFFDFFFQIPLGKEKVTQDGITILTYNVGGIKRVNSGKPKDKTSTQILKFIDSVNADILVIQESPKSIWKKIKGYPYVFSSYRYNVDKSLQTIYSKYPIVNQGFIDFPDTFNNAIYADVKIKHDTIRVYNSHLQSFIISENSFAKKFDDYNYLKQLNKTPEKQIRQVRMIKSHANASNKKLIICGDFNATQYSRTYRIVKDDLNDSYIDKGYGFGTTFSFLKYPLRLDYFLTDYSIDILSHDNFSLNLSDHEPIMIKFMIN